ncbi:MAG TPA: hypothetical protein VMT79_00065 [Candidatus Binatia bacterium]|jgi:hypothetical protein|nr:hypothetical protein [Candidatus Binatia bacterium]
MSLNPTPPDALTDARGRPYFLWDCDLTVAQFAERLRDPSPDVRAYFIAKLMRQAKPDDVFQFVTLTTIHELWPRVVRFLGQSKPFWTWLLDAWGRPPHARR